MSKERLLKLLEEYNASILSYFEHIRCTGTLFNLDDDREVSIYMAKKLENFRIGVKHHIVSLLELGYNIEKELSSTCFEDSKNQIKLLSCSMELLQEAMRCKNFMPKVIRIYEELTNRINSEEVSIPS